MIMTTKSADIAVKNGLATDKLLVGTNKTLEAVRIGKAKTVILSANCPDDIRGDMLSSVKLSDVEVIDYSQNSRMLGTICKKQFPAVAVCILK